MMILGCIDIIKPKKKMNSFFPKKKNHEYGVGDLQFRDKNHSCESISILEHEFAGLQDL